jgi:flavin reductase (DIM6/NTAB) family NADH-FMN oxidoreductase RutF
VTGSPQPFDKRHYRTALGRFATGVTVVTTPQGDTAHGMTANAFVSVSLEPPLVLVSVKNDSNTHRILQGATRYGVSILGEDQEPLSNHFAGRPDAGISAPFVERHGMLLVKDALAYFVVRVTNAHPAGDHTLYIGEVEHYEINRDGNPLLFYGGQYHRLPGAEPSR